MTSYWNGSAWVDMVNPSTTNSASVGFSVQDIIGLPRMCQIRVQNSSSTPFSNSGSTSKGPFTGLLGDFMPIKVTDTDTNDILFYGLIKDVVESYANDFGQVIDIVGEDYLMELRDNSTKNAYGYKISSSANLYDAVQNTDLKNNKTKEWSTTVSSRSGLIKSFLNQFSENIEHPGDANSGDIRFTESVKKFSETQNYELGGSGQKTALAHILGLAIADPHTASGETEYGYDYYLNPNFTSPDASHKPKAYFNYFKRGTRPSSTPATYGLTVDYPSPDTTANGKYSQTNQRLAMTDFTFERPKDDIFTEVNVDFKQTATDTEGDTVVSGHSVKMELWTVEDTTDIGDFIWSGKYIDGTRKGQTVAERLKLAMTTLTSGLGSGASDLAVSVASTAGMYVGQQLLIGTSSEILTVDAISSLTSLTVSRGSPRAAHSNGATVYARDVATIQFVSNTTDVGSSGTIYVLVSGIDQGLEGDTTNIWQTGTSSKLWVGETSGSSFKLKGRPRLTYGVRRTTELSTGSNSKQNSIRELVAAKLMKDTFQIVRGDFKTYEAPRFYFDNSPTTVSGSNTALSPYVMNFSGGVNPQNYGFTPGMTVVKLDSSGNPTSTYGYAKTVGTSTVTVQMTGTVAGTDTLRYYVPVRAGDLINLRNDLVDVDGKYLVTKTKYDVGNGGITFTTFEVVGAEEVKETGSARTSALSSLSNAVSTDEGLPPNLPFSSSIANSSTSLIFESVAADTVKWHGAGSDTTPGTININGNTYNVNAGNTGTMNSDGRDYYIYYNQADDELLTIEKSSWDTVTSKDTLLVGHAKYFSPEAIFSIFVREFNTMNTKFDAAGRIAKYSVSAQLQKKGTQPWSTSTVFSGTARNAFSWSSGALSFADDDTETINVGSRTMANTTEYIYKIVGDNASPTLQWTAAYNVVFDDDKVMLATVVAAPATTDNNGNDTSPDSPTIIPFNGNQLSISAGAIATNVLTAANIKAGSITTAELNFTPQANDSDKTAGSVGGWALNANQIYSGSIVTSGYTAGAGDITLNSSGSIHTPNFYVNTDGSAGFKGTVTIGGNNLTTTNTLNENTTATDVGLDLVDNDSTATIRGGVTPIHVSDNMTGVTMTAAGNIYSGSKSTYGSNTAGWFIGFDSGTPKINIGSGSSRLRWTGTSLEVVGQITLSDGTSEADIKNSNTTSTDVGLNAYDGNTPAGIEAAALAGNHTGNLNGLDINNTSGSRIHFSSSGIIGYTTGTTRSFALSSNPNSYPLRVYGQYAGESSGDSQSSSDPLRGIEFINSSSYIASISPTTQNSQLRYDAYNHDFRNFHQGGYIKGLYSLHLGDAQSAGQGSDTFIDANATKLIVQSSETYNQAIKLSATGNGGDILIENNASYGSPEIRIESDAGPVMISAKPTSATTLDPVTIKHGNTMIAEFKRQYSWGTDYQHMVSTNILPDVNNVRDIGLSTRRYNEIYLVNNPNVSSDATLKENMIPISDGLDVISSLNPLQYNRIGTTATEFGFTAQNVKEVMDARGYVDTSIYSIGEDDSLGLQYSQLIAPLVASIQELKKRIEELEKGEA